MKTLDPDDRKSILEFSRAKSGDLIEFIVGGRSVCCAVMDCTKLHSCRGCLLSRSRNGGSSVPISLCLYMFLIIREAMESGDIAYCSTWRHLMLVPLEEVVE